MTHTVACRFDGRAASLTVEAGTTLAEALGQPVGCGEGVCGSCTLLVDGMPVRSCLMLAMQAEGAEILGVRSLPEIESAAADAAGLTPLQNAVMAFRAFQCGWCMPGFLVGTAAFLRDRLEVDTRELQTHFAGHLCRCIAGAGMAEAVAALLAARREALP